MPRWASRTDATHQELLDALRAVGWEMVSTHQLANFVDAVGWHPSHGVMLFEFKTRTGGLTESQQQLVERGWPIVILRSVDDVVVFTERGAA